MTDDIDIVIVGNELNHKKHQHSYKSEFFFFRNLIAAKRTDNIRSL